MLATLASFNFEMMFLAFSGNLQQLTQGSLFQKYQSQYYGCF